VTSQLFFFFLDYIPIYLEITPDSIVHSDRCNTKRPAPMPEWIPKMLVNSKPHQPNCSYVQPSIFPSGPALFAILSLWSKALIDSMSPVFNFGSCKYILRSSTWHEQTAYIYIFPLPLTICALRHSRSTPLNVPCENYLSCRYIVRRS